MISIETLAKIAFIPIGFYLWVLGMRSAKEFDQRADRRDKFYEESLNYLKKIDRHLEETNKHLNKFIDKNSEGR